MFFTPVEVIEPCDMEMLRTVLDEICADEKIEVGSEQGAKYARELMDWFLFGIRTDRDLKAMLAPL